MRFADLALQNALDAWRRNPDVRERAVADNAWFEERVSTARLAAFESGAGGASDPEALAEWQVRYVRNFMEIDAGIPHTFIAELEPAVLSVQGLEPYQWIVRLESLARAFNYWAVPDGFDPLETLRTARAENNTAVIDGFLNTWNESSVRDFRPAFAIWKDQLPELATDDWADDWADQLRDPSVWNTTTATTARSRWP